MVTKRKVFGEIKSDKGFYIGDICYALGREKYDELWGDQHGYDDGVIEDSEDTGLKFAVSGTRYGDGEYPGSDGCIYGVDAGVIGLVPLELVEREGAECLGRIVRRPGIATFAAEDGDFTIKLPDGEVVFIDTEYDGDEEEDDDWD
jgi:hypothetical protein